MKFEIRPAEEQDREEIRRIVRGARLYPFELDWRRFYVALEGGSIIGVGQIKVHGDGAKEMASIAILPRFQRKGAASSLINKLISISDRELYLMCRDELESFYMQFGFRAANRGELPSSIARRQWLGDFMYRISSAFSRHNGRIIAMRLVDHGS